MSVRISRRANGKWEADIIVRLPDGRRIRRRVISPISSREGTARWAAKYEQQLLTGELAAERRAPAPTLEAFAPRYLEACEANRQKASGITRKRSILRIHLLPRFGPKRLSAIRTGDVEALKAALAQAAPSTVNNVLSVLGNLLKVAVEWGELEQMPCMVRLVRRPEHEMEFHDFEEYERLVAAARGVDWRAELIVLLGGRAGLRLGEMVALRWVDVDLERQRISVRQNEWRGHVDAPKGGKSGYVPIVSELRDALRRHRHLRGPRVLHRNDGGALSEGQVQRIVARVEREAGLPPRGVHALRHTFGAHLAMRGAAPKAIQVALRHRDLSVTQRYLHLSPAALDEAVHLLEGGPWSREKTGSE